MMATIAHASEPDRGDVDIEAARAALLKILQILDEPLMQPREGDENDG
jgi:hypothetical protein